MVHLANARDLTISASRADEKLIYAWELTVNGKTTTKGWLFATAFTLGAALTWTMSGAPGLTWGGGPMDMPPRA